MKDDLKVEDFNSFTRVIDMAAEHSVMTFRNRKLVYNLRFDSESSYTVTFRRRGETGLITTEHATLEEAVKAYNEAY